MLNSFLPLLTSRHPSVQGLPKAEGTSDTSAIEVSSPVAILSNKISSLGVALGYSTSVFVQLLAIAIILLSPRFTTSTTLPLRSILFIVGAWWAIFTAPTALFLRPRPGPPLPASLVKSTAYSTQRRPIFTFLRYLSFAWSSLYRTLRLALSLRQLRLYLLAWFLLSDANATVGTTAVLFARTTLGLPPTGVALLSITATCSGIAGSLLWPVISRKYSLSTNRTIVACITLMLTVPVYGLLGYLPPIRALGFLGLQQAWEIFPLAVVYGVAQGGLSSYCRSFFGQLIPPGQEVAFYALFAITDKGSSAIGPTIVGRITDATGSIRPAFIFLFFLIGVPIFLVRKVNEEKGKREAEAVAARLIESSEEEFELAEHPIESEGLMSQRSY
jgi:MFS transporter, UMF1 family